MSNIKVAVRVRPLNKKEKDEGSKEIIQVQGDTLSIENVKLFGITDVADSRERIKHFVFDHCYDCMAGGSTDSSNAQAVVFQDLGTDVLQAAFDGFNACVFAYGQTGTGKTYSMMGQQEDVGLIPRICETLFSHVADCADDNVTCRVDISYYEIYNERVRDLLQPELLKQNEKYSLKVREHPKEGPYVKDLSWHRVRDNNEIQALLDTGNDYRVTAETYMHDHSSRSHAIVTVCFTQARLEENRPSEIVSKIHMVDLAGSERADPSSRPGFRKRLTEGANINRSLVTLGYVIKALAEKSLLSWSTEDMGSIQNFQSSGGGECMASNSPSGPNKQRLPYIPYRDSVLTWLLKDSLGGNAKTIMIATVTPASQYYSETISTLRYAQRAKNIINKPRINEDSNVALIRELRKEIERLHSMLADAQSPTPFGDTLYLVPILRKNCHNQSGNLLTLPDSEDSKIAERLHENEEMAKQLTQSWMCKWSSTHDIMKESDLSIRGLRNRTSSMGVMIDSQLPYLVAMDDDILSTGVCIFHLKEGETLIGREDSDREQDIVLMGPHIEKEHCFIQNLEGIVTLVPSLGAMCAVQGIEITEPTKLSQGDFIVLGGNQVFRFNNPTEAAKLREHRRSQGSLTTLSTSHLSFGGLSRASSYNSIMSEDPSSLSPHSQYLKSSYPKRRHSDHVVYAAADLCLDLERRYKSENERIEEARTELKKLQEEHEKSEEVRQEEEERMYQMHEQHRQEIDDQRQHLARLIEENQRAREKAEEELELARESLAKEKDAFQKQLVEEREKLKQLQQQESLAVQTEPLQTSSIATDPDIDVFSQGTQGDIVKPKYTSDRKLSTEDQLQELDRVEFERKLSYRETEQSLSIQQEDLEDQYQATQEQIEAKIEKIKQIEDQYKELDKTHLKEISAQTEKLEVLRKKESELEVYIEEKEELMKVQTDLPRPLRNATSELFLLNPQLQDLRFPQKTTSLSDIQAGVESDSSLGQKTPLSVSSESLNSPLSPVAMDTSALAQDVSRSKSGSAKKRPVELEEKPSKISNVARDVTSRLYKPPEPKFKYVPKAKDKDSKTMPAGTRSSREKNGSPIGRGSSPKTLNDSYDKRHSPSPLRAATPKGRGSPTDKRHSPSPLRDSSKKSSPSSSKERGINQKTTSSKEEITKTPSKRQFNHQPSNDAKRKDTGEGGFKAPRKESAVMAVRNKQYQSDSAIMRRSPDRLGFVASRLGGSSPLRQMASASSLASVPESLSEEDNGPLSTSGSSEPIIKKRARRGRAYLDDDEFRRHSAPDYEKLESDFNAYSKEMGVTPGERVCLSPPYKNSVSVDESVLSDFHHQVSETKSDVCPSAKSDAAIQSEVVLPSDKVPQQQNSEFYISSNDEMTCDENDTRKDHTEMDSLESVQPDLNTTEQPFTDRINSHENKTETESIVIGTKRDHSKKSEGDISSVPPNKKSKSESSETDLSEIKVSDSTRDVDDGFSDDSLDSNNSADSLENDQITISSVRFKDRKTNLDLDDSLEKMNVDQNKDEMDSCKDIVQPKEVSMISEAYDSDSKEELGMKEPDTGINNENMETIQPDTNESQEVINKDSFEKSDSAKTDGLNLEEIEPFMDYEERYIVSLNIIPNVESHDSTVENQDHFDRSNSDLTSQQQNNMLNVPSNQGLANDSDHDNLTDKFCGDSDNVVSMDIARDMKNQETKSQETIINSADAENVKVHEELEVNLLLEGEKPLTHEELEVILKLHGQTCLLSEAEKAKALQRKADSEKASKLKIEIKSGNVAEEMSITEELEAELTEDEMIEHMEIEDVKQSNVDALPDIFTENQEIVSNINDNKDGIQSECKEHHSDIVEPVSNEICEQSEIEIGEEIPKSVENKPTHQSRNVEDNEQVNSIHAEKLNGTKSECMEYHSDIIKPVSNEIHEQIEIEKGEEIPRSVENKPTHQSRNVEDNEHVNSVHADKLNGTESVDSNLLDGISATEILPHTRSLAVWTSLEYIAEVDVTGSHGSDDSLLDPQQELQVLQDALGQLPAKSSTKDGPQLSTARRAARQRAMIRKELRTTDSDGVSVLSDDSPASGNLSKSSSRPGSGSRRRRRPNGRGVDIPTSLVNEQTTDDYISSDSDSLYSDDSLRESSERLGGQDAVTQNGEDLNGNFEKFSVSSFDSTDLESSDMLPHNYKDTHHLRHSPRPGGDGKRSVGIQTRGHTDRLHSSGSTRTDTSEDIDISFASVDYSSLGRNMVVSPLSIWNSDNREESDRISERHHSSSSGGVGIHLNDMDRSMTPTPRSSARSSSSVFSLTSNLDRGPTEVWSSSASDLRKLYGFREDLGYVMETEGLWPGQYSFENQDDTQSQRSWSVRTPVHSERSCSTPNNSAKIVHVTFPEGQYLASEALSPNVPVNYHVTIHEDNTNILYNVDKTEYKTYSLRNQSDIEVPVIPDTIHVNLTESVTSETCEKYESKKTEDITFNQPEDDDDSGDDSLLLERSFRSSCSSEREIISESGAVLHEIVTEKTGKTEEKSCSQVPSTENQVNKRKVMSNLQSSGIIESTDYSGSKKSKVGEDLESHNNSDRINVSEESDNTSDYGTFTSIDGRKGLVCFNSDSENGGSVTVTPSISPRASHISISQEYSKVPEQGVEAEISPENIGNLPAQSENICSVEDTITPPVIAARLCQSSPSQVVCNQANIEAKNDTDINLNNIENSIITPVDVKHEPHSSEISSNDLNSVFMNPVDNNGNIERMTESNTKEENKNVPSQEKKLSTIQSPIHSPRCLGNLGSSLSSTDDVYLSLEKLETSTSSSDYHTPQQSPRQNLENGVSKLVTDVEIPDFDSEKSSASPTPREGQSMKENLENDILNEISLPNKAADVRTVSVNTEAVSLVSHSPAITQQTPFDESDPVYTEKMRKELENKIATLKHKVRSLSDSAISSDFTDYDSSPRGSRLYDAEKHFGDNRSRFTGPPSNQGIYNTSQSPLYDNKQFHFESSEVKKSLFADSGNVYDHEDVCRDMQEAKEKDNGPNDICAKDSIIGAFICEPQNESRKHKETPVSLEQASKVEYIPRADAVDLFPEGIVDAILAIKPYPYPRSASLDSLSACLNVDPRISRAVRNLRTATTNDSKVSHQDEVAAASKSTRESHSVDQQGRMIQPANDLNIHELGQNVMFSDQENQTSQIADNRATGKSTSLCELDPTSKQEFHTKEIHRSLSEGNIDDFDDHDSSSSSSDSITFVFVDKYQQSNANVEDVIYQRYDARGECSASESQSPDSRPISGLAPSGTESEDYTNEMNTEEKRIYLDGFPGGLQSEEVLCRTDSRHSGSCVDILDQSSSHSESEEIEEIEKLNGGLSKIEESKDLNIRLDNDSPGTYTDPSDERMHSDGLDQNVGNSESLEEEPLRHKFGIDESVLPIPDRPMSADNLPNHRLKFKDIQRSRSADMVAVGGTHEQESEEGIFPPAMHDEAQTDPSMSLRTMSEGGIDQVSQRTVSELGVTYSSRTSSELDSVTSSSESSVAKMQDVQDRSCSQNSESEEEFHEEEIIIHFAQPVCTYQTLDYHSMRKPSSLTSEASEGEIDPAVLQDDDHIREVIRTVEKFIMPKQALVDHATSTDDESCSRYVSIGIQTSFLDSSTQTAEANPMEVNPNQIILPALAAPFRAQSMDSFGLGATSPGLVLPEGTDNWCTLGQLMIETTNLLKRINERLPDLDKLSSVSSSNETQAILQKWHEISVQTGYSLTDLTTVGLQTDDTLTQFSRLLKDAENNLKTSVESTQIDTQFKIKPLDVSEISTSELVPGPAETISCEISIQTDPATSEVAVMETVQMSFQPDDKNIQLGEEMHGSKTAGLHLVESDSEIHYRRDTKVVLPSPMKDEMKVVESPMPLDQTKQTDDTLKKQDTLQLTQEVPQKFAAEAPVSITREMPAPLNQVTLADQSEALPSQQNMEDESDARILSANSPQIEELRKEHAKLIENLRKATDGRKERQSQIKLRKHPLESITVDTPVNESAIMEEVFVRKPKAEKQPSQREVRKSPSSEISTARDETNYACERSEEMLSPKSPHEIVKISIQSDHDEGIKVENTIYKTKAFAAKMSPTKVSAKEDELGMLHEQTWQLTGDAIMTISEEKPDLTGELARTASSSSVSSDGTTESEIVSVMAGHNSSRDPVEYAAARAGALNPLFKNETDVIDDVLGNDLLKQGNTETTEPEPVIEKMIKRLVLKPELFYGDYAENYNNDKELHVEIPVQSRDTEEEAVSVDSRSPPAKIFPPEEETIVPKIYTRNNALPSQFPAGSNVPDTNEPSESVKEPIIESRETTLIEEPAFVKSETSPKFKTQTVKWPDKVMKKAVPESVKEPIIESRETTLIKEPVFVKRETSPKFKASSLQWPDKTNKENFDVKILPSSNNEKLNAQPSAAHTSDAQSSTSRPAPPRFGQSDDSTQVSMEFSDDYTQTDLDTSADTVIHVPVGKDKTNDKQDDIIKKVHSDTLASPSRPVKDGPDVSNSMTRELQRLQDERGDIMELLSLNYLPASLTVELLEAKLNYCIGQTDLLLGSVDESFKPTDKSKSTIVDQHFAKEYIAKYRADLKKSKQDIQRCRERLQRNRTPVSGRGRGRIRNRDLFEGRRLAQIEAFKLERLREQQDYERSRCSTPVKGNTPIRGNSPLKGNSPIVTPRSNLSRDSSPDYSPAYMTPKEHKAHFGDLRKQLIRNVLEEERQHTRSCSPSLLGHHPMENHNLDTSFGFSPKVSVSVSDVMDRDISTYSVAPGTTLDSPRTSSMDRYPHLSANYYQHPHPARPKPELDTKMTAESIFSPQESEQILKEIEEIQRRTQMAAPVEGTPRSSSFSSTHSPRSVNSLLSPQAKPKRSSPFYRSSSPLSKHQDEPLKLNLDYLQDSHHGDQEDNRPYSPYSAYAREHVLPNERTHDSCERSHDGGVLRGSYELYDSMPHDRSHDRSYDDSMLSNDSDNCRDSPLNEQRLSRLRPVRSSDIKAKISRHKR